MAKIRRFGKPRPGKEEGNVAPPMMPMGMKGGSMAQVLKAGPRGMRDARASTKGVRGRSYS